MTTLNRHFFAVISIAAAITAHAQSDASIESPRVDDQTSTSLSAPTHLEASPQEVPTASAKVEKLNELVKTPDNVPTTPLPEGVITTRHPLKQEVLARRPNLRPYVYRPSENMPEVVNEDFLRGYIEGAKAPSPGEQVTLGYLPKLKIVPCDDGCSGSDYEKAVKRLIEGYGGAGIFSYRGELPVKVRWYRFRNFLERRVPLSTDEFGLSFMLEGKMISIGQRTMSGSRATAADMAEVVGGRLALQLSMTLGMGVKPPYLDYDPNNVEGWAVALDNVLAVGRGVEKLMGRDDLRTRIEPVPDKLADVLSPAIDGIKPGEINPINQVLIPVSEQLF